MSSQRFFYLNTFILAESKNIHANFELTSILLVVKIKNYNKYMYVCILEILTQIQIKLLIALNIEGYLFMLKNKLLPITK